MDTVAVVGLDLAKNIFQVHGVGANGGVVVRRQIRRGQVLAFFSSLKRRAWSASKPARRRIIGLVS